MNWRDYIEFSNEKFPGVAYCKSTNISVNAVLVKIWLKGSDKEIIEAIPELRPEHIEACRRYIDELAQFEQMIDINDSNYSLLLERFRKTGLFSLKLN